MSRWSSWVVGLVLGLFYLAGEELGSFIGCGLLLDVYKFFGFGLGF